jgi:hypothetical protein
MSDIDLSACLEDVDDWDASLEEESRLAEAIEIVDELEFDAVDEFFVEDAGSTEGADPFVRFVGTVAAAARAAGAPATTLSAIPALFGLERLDREDGQPLRAARLTSQVHAWMAVLRGDETDLGLCGSLPLDEWAAGIVAHAAGDATLAAAVRRELRGRGVLAFGLLAA